MRILLVEEDKDTLEGIINEIENDFIIDIANNGVDGSYLSQTNDYDVIVIDSVLPDVCGSDFCVMTRKADIDTPIVILSEDSERRAKIESLEAGADALVGKPIDGDELKAELKALIRRNNKKRTEIILAGGRIRVDFNLKLVCVDNNPILLRRKEYDLIEYLAINKNTVVSKEKILEHVWDLGIEIFSNTLEVHIKNIRDKVEKPHNLNVIKTVRGFGYKIE